MNDKWEVKKIKKVITPTVARDQPQLSSISTPVEIIENSPRFHHWHSQYCIK